MKKTLLTLTIASAPLLFTSCGNVSYAEQQNMATGALIGAVAGGIIGNQSGNALEGAALGAAGGGFAGHALTPKISQSYNSNQPRTNQYPNTAQNYYGY